MYLLTQGPDARNVVPVSTATHPDPQEVTMYGQPCTCPEFDATDYDGPHDHAAACDNCPTHGTSI